MNDNQRPNVVVVVTDTLRKDFLGCFGNTEINTPHIDKFAQDSFIFDNAYSESLPTIPVRRALHTGRRAFPFKTYSPVKWDIVYLPGWQAIDNAEDTLAENLSFSGYHTGFVSDTLPYFAPGFNFTRGFWQWEYIRGEQQDRWKSPYSVRSEDLQKYGDPEKLRKVDRKSRLRPITLQHTANTAWMTSDEETVTARVFKWGMNFLEDNQSAEPFYLFIDAFKPHEPWEAPEKYYSMYKDPSYEGPTTLHTEYGPIDKKYSPEMVKDLVAHYSGLCTEIDDWFGKMIEKLKSLNLWENTVIVFVSDHGTCFGDNESNTIGKPSYAMYPSVINVPLMVYVPQKLRDMLNFQRSHEEKITELVYNLDYIPLIYELAKIDIKKNKISLDGQNLLNLFTEKGWNTRNYLTSRYKQHLWYRDEQYWIIFTVKGKIERAFDLHADPELTTNIKKSISKSQKKEFWGRIMDDAGGNIPDYSRYNFTDAIGQKKIK